MNRPVSNKPPGSGLPILNFFDSACKIVNVEGMVSFHYIALVACLSCETPFMLYTKQAGLPRRLLHYEDMVITFNQFPRIRCRAESLNHCVWI